MTPVYSRDVPRKCPCPPCQRVTEGAELLWLPHGRATFRGVFTGGRAGGRPGAVLQGALMCLSTWAQSQPLVSPCRDLPVGFREESQGSVFSPVARAQHSSLVRQPGSQPTLCLQEKKELPQLGQRSVPDYFHRSEHFQFQCWDFWSRLGDCAPLWSSRL